MLDDTGESFVFHLHLQMNLPKVLAKLKFCVSKTEAREGKTKSEFRRAEADVNASILDAGIGPNGMAQLRNK